MKYIYLFIGLLLFGCAQDIGNYDYEEQEVTIGGVTDQVLLDVIALKDKLEIKPTVTFNNSEVSESDYAYEWRLIPTKLNEKPEDGDKFIISNEKNLSYYIAKESPGKYYGIFNVINKKTGNISFKTFYVNVRSMTAEGWAVLCDDNGKSRLDWIFQLDETNDEFLLDMWRDFPEYQEWLGSPICLNFIYSLNASLRVVSGSNGSFNLLAEEPKIVEEGNMIYQFGTSLKRFDVRGGILDISYNGAGAIMGVIDDKGDVYLKPVTSGSLFDFRMNRNFAWDPPYTYFPVSPHVAVAEYKPNKSKAVTVFYDTEGCRFVMMAANTIKNLVAVNFPSNGNIVMGSTANCEMIFMETTHMNNSYALLRNKITGKYYIYGFVLDNNVTQPRPIIYNEVNVGSNDLTKVTGVSFNSTYDLAFISSENKVYAVQMDPNTSGAVVDLFDTNAFTFPNEKIVKIFAPRYAAWIGYPDWKVAIQNKLIVVSNDSSKPDNESGAIRIYNTHQNGLNSKPYKDYSNKGLGKIVDVKLFEQGK